MDSQHRGRVLIIAGSDSGGGAGVQADIKTVTALGGYAATAITAITVQNTLGVQDVLKLPADLVTAQAKAVLDDIGADAIKTGMLARRSTVLAVADLLEAFPDIPAVIDPVMIAKGGQSLLSAKALDLMINRLLPRADLLTPNEPEAGALTGVAVTDLDSQRRAAEPLMALGVRAVLIKGGHIPGKQVLDLLVTSEGETLLEGPRLDTPHTHGTGCTLASASGALGVKRSARGRRRLIMRWSALPDISD